MPNFCNIFTCFFSILCFSTNSVTKEKSKLKKRCVYQKNQTLRGACVNSFVISGSLAGIVLTEWRASEVCIIFNKLSCQLIKQERDSKFLIVLKYNFRLFRFNSKRKQSGKHKNSQGTMSLQKFKHIVLSGSAQ